MACGDEHSMVLDANGDVYTWGSNQFGQLGSDVPVGGSTHVPTLLKSRFDQPVMQIQAEGYISFART
jgi:alpha-tubulin suppressor-like RCC1 family protein